MDKKHQKERQAEKRTAELHLMIKKLEQEITEHKQVEGTLQDSQRVSSTLISNLPGMVYRCLNDQNLSITYISEGCVALTGYQARDFTENRITYGRLIRPDDQDVVRDGMQAALRAKKPFTFTYRIKTASGEEKWVWEQGRGVFARDGELLFFEGFIIDITERKKMEEALRESEKRFRSLYDDNPSMYFTVDADGTVLSVNRFGMEQLGYRTDELVGHSVLTVFHEGDRQKALECLRIVFQSPAQVHQWELRKVRKDGCVLWVREDVRIIHDAAGKPLALMVCEDITKQKQMQEALRASETELRALFAAMTDVVLVLDFQGRYMQIAPTNPVLLYKPPTELLGKTIHAVLPKEKADLVLDCILRALKTGQPLNVEYSLHIHDTEVWFDGRVSPLSHNTVFWIARDITERKQMEEALRRSEKRMVLLSHRLLEVQEAERRYVARELHDEIGQCLTGLKLGLETALRLRESEARRVLLQLVEQADSLISKSRELSLDLRPAMLDDMGLLPALFFHFERFRERLGIRVRFEHRGIEGRLHPCLETAVFRIVQEALTNVARHAQVEEAMVTIMADEDGLTVHVKDEGVGFDPDKAIAPGKAVGLSGIHERAILLGGHCDVKSAPGIGTQVRVRFTFSEVGKREAASRAEMEEHD